MPQSSSQPRTRDAWSLTLGAALFVVLTVVNLLAYRSEPTLSDSYLRFAPSHVAPIRALLGGERVREYPESAGAAFGGSMGNSEAAADTTMPDVPTVFTTRPSPIARVGQLYRYEPATRVALKDYQLQLRDQADEATVAWLTVDPATGIVTGSADRAGTFEVELRGTMENGQTMVQRFTLWADTRFLLFGTDDDGRDIAYGLFQASRSTVVPATIAVIIAVGFGVLLGAVSGYYGGEASRSLGGVSAVVQSVPGLLLIALAGRLSEWNLLVMMSAVGVVMLPETATGVRELVERFRRRDFVEAARELGMRDSEILWKEIIWHNGRRFVASRTFQAFSFAVLAEVTLGFLGVTDSLTPSVGRVFLVGRENEFRATMMVPALAYLLLVILCFGLIERGLILRWSRRR
jgi:peptide/nickel transport system permease protein